MAVVLELAGKAELSQFLGKLIRRGVRKIRNAVRSLRRVVGWALPVTSGVPLDPPIR